MSRNVICSNGIVVRYERDQVSVVDAIHAIIPRFKTRNTTHARNKILRECGLEQYFSKEQNRDVGRGAKLKMCDLPTFEKIVEVLSKYELDAILDENTHRKPYDVDFRIVDQVTQGFNRWGKTWFPPFKD